jgi:hypothetical protein
MAEVFQSVAGQMASGEHVYHHNVSDGPKVNVKVEKNSRGFNYEVTVTGASNVDEAMAILKDAEAKLAAQYSATPA